MGRRWRVLGSEYCLHSTVVEGRRGDEGLNTNEKRYAACKNEILIKILKRAG